MIKTAIERWALATIIIGMCYSCNKFVEIEAPQNQVVSSTVFTEDATATSAVLGIYSTITTNNGYFLNGAFAQFCGLSAEEIYRTAANTEYDAFYTNNIASNNRLNRVYLWQFAYQFIYQANACLEGLEQSAGITSSLKTQLLGELKFIRALCYFHLVNLYGDVPLITTTNYHENLVMPRTATAEIYNQIIADLKDAETLLPVTYLSADRIRPNKWTAASLLAKVYLYQQDWKNAEIEATSVISSGTYSLESLANAFLATSKETIFQIYPASSTYNSAEGGLFIPSTASSTRPNSAITTFLLNAFEPNDKRKTNWINNKTVSGTTYYYPYKFKVRSGAAKTEYNIVFRLAELYLIRAEARAQQGSISGTNGAAADLNVIRTRAGLNGTPASSQQDMLIAIEKERQTELFCEWGNRWFDLKRTGRVDAVLGAEKSSWKPTAALYPIPLSEIQSNPFLTQNPGYAN